MDGLKPGQRIFDIRTQGDSHGRHLVAHLFCLISGPHRDRCHGNQGGFRQLPLGLKIFAYCSAANGQHRIVDGGPGNGRLDLFHLLQIKGSALNHSVTRDHMAEAGSRRQAIYAVALLCQARLETPHGRHGPGHHLSKTQWLGHVVELGPGYQLKGIGLFLAPPVLRRSWRRRRVGFNTVNGFGDIGTGHPINAGMVNFRDDGVTTFRQAGNTVQTFNDGKFPERSSHVQLA